MTVMCVSCAEDRTHEYEEKTAGNHWMQEVMQEWYLWGDSLQELDWKQYFATPSVFVSRLTSQSKAGDRWTYCTVDTVVADDHKRGTFNRYNSYGLDLSLMTDPTGETTKQYARVLTVYPGSPAERCGLRRGDFISQVGESKMSSKVMGYLEKGGARTLVVTRLDVSEDDETVFWADTDTLQMEPSEQVSVATVMKYGMLASDVAYIMLTDMNDFDSMRQPVNALVSQHPSDLIVDVRLCNAGTIDCAVQLARTIGSASGTLLRTIWNSNKSSNNTTYDIESSVGCNLFFITGSYTQGAAEWLIWGLRSLNPYGVTVVGTATAGQTVLLHDFATQYYYTIHAAVAFVADAAADYSYKNGITPDEIINEFDYVQLYPYGDTRETVVAYIMDNH